MIWLMGILILIEMAVIYWHLTQWLPTIPLTDKQQLFAWSLNIIVHSGLLGIGCVIRSNFYA